MKPGGGMGMKKKKRSVGAGLSLDKFASAAVSKYDKRKVLEKKRKEHMIRKSKYSKLKHKLEAQGVLKPLEVKDSVAELDKLEGRASEDPDDHDKPSTSGRSTAQPAAVATAVVAAPKRKHTPLEDDETEAPQAPGTGKRTAAVPQLGRPAGHGAAAGRLPAQQHGPRSGAARGDVHHDFDEADRDGEARQHKGPKQGGKDAKPWQRGPKAQSSLQHLARKVALDKEQQRQANEEAQKARNEKLQRLAAAERERKQEKHKFFKRTASGQPLMRYRMEKLLAKIQQG